MRLMIAAMAAIPAHIGLLKPFVIACRMAVAAVMQLFMLDLVAGC